MQLKLSKLAILFGYVLCVAGCASNVKQSDSPTTSASASTIALKEAANQARLSFLKQQIIATGGNPDNLLELNALYSLMLAVQNGKITTEQLSGRHFFFKDSIGTKNNIMESVNEYFRCIQVIDVKNTEPGSNKVPVYKALYGNNSIHITASVIWGGTRPLEGQMLNVDYLSFSGVDSYEAKDGSRRSELIFVRPYWAGRNGDVR
jgi:hypothetical protein